MESGNRGNGNGDAPERGRVIPFPEGRRTRTVSLLPKSLLPLPIVEALQHALERSSTDEDRRIIKGVAEVLNTAWERSLQSFDRLLWEAYHLEKQGVAWEHAIRRVRAAQWRHIRQRHPEPLFPMGQNTSPSAGVHFATLLRYVSITVAQFLEEATRSPHSEQHRINASGQAPYTPEAWDEAGEFIALECLPSLWGELLQSIAEQMHTAVLGGNQRAAAPYIAVWLGVAHHAWEALARIATAVHYHEAPPERGANEVMSWLMRLASLLFTTTERREEEREVNQALREVAAWFHQQTEAWGPWWREVVRETCTLYDQAVRPSVRVWGGRGLHNIPELISMRASLLKSLLADSSPPDHAAPQSRQALPAQREEEPHLLSLIQEAAALHSAAAFPQALVERAALQFAAAVLKGGGGETVIVRAHVMRALEATLTTQPPQLRWAARRLFEELNAYYRAHPSFPEALFLARLARRLANVAGASRPRV